MKLHLPCKLLAAVLACFSAVVSQTLGADSISINFNSNIEGGAIADDTTAGIVEVTGANWNQAANADGSTEGLKLQDGTASKATATWTSATTWSAGGCALLNGYLDDGSPGAEIEVGNLGFSVYRVYIYANTDTANANFTGVTANGTTYTYADGTTVVGRAAWGSNADDSQPVLGTNTLCIAGLTGSLTIQGGTKNDSTRGCIAGIQIVETTGYAATLSGDSTWAEKLPEWVDSSAVAGSYASFTIEGDATLALVSTRTTDAVLVSGGDLTLTGGTLNLLYAGQIATDAETTLTIDSDVTGSFNATGGQIVLNGTVDVEGLEVTGDVTINGTATISNLGGTGNVTIGENATMGVTASSFTGTLNMSADAYNAYDFWAHTVQAIHLSGEGEKSINYTISGTVSTITYEGGDDLLDWTGIKKGSNSLTITGADASKPDKLIVQEGTLGINGTETIKSVLVQSGATLELSGEVNHTISTLEIEAGGNLLLPYGSGMRGDIILHGGGSIDIRNGSGGHVHLGAAGNTITIDAVDQNAVIIGSIYGGNSRIDSDITGNGTLEFQKGSNGNKITINGTISDGEGGQLTLVMTDGERVFAGEATHTGGTTINGGTVTVGANSSLGNGDTTINGGTVTVGASGSLGNGDISMTGGTLKFSQDTSSAIAAVDGRKVEFLGGTLDSSASAWHIEDVDLTLGAATFSGANNVTISGSGTTTLAGTITNNISGGTLSITATLEAEDLNGFAIKSEGGGYYLGGEGMEGNGYHESTTYWLTKAGEGSTLDIGDTLTVKGSSVTIEATEEDEAEQGTCFTVTEAGGVFYVNTGTENYKQGQAIASAATTGITLNGGNLNLTMSLAESVKDDFVLLQDATITVGSEATLYLSDVNNDAAKKLTLDGTGRVELSSSDTSFVSLSSSGLHDLNTNRLALADTWAGTVAVVGGTCWTLDMDSLANGKASIVELKGVTGNIDTSTHAANIVLVDDGDKAALTLNNGGADSTTTFSGSISGSGTLYHHWSNAGSGNGLYYKFTGDVSQWTGTLKTWESAGSSRHWHFVGNPGVAEGEAALIQVTIEHLDNDVLDLRFENSNAAGLEVASTITGNVAVTYAGTAAKTVSSSGSTYTGGTIITANSGTVTVTGNDALGHGTVTINAGAKLCLQNGPIVDGVMQDSSMQVSSIGGEGTFEMTGGKLTFTENGTYSGALNAGTVNLKGGELNSGDNGWWVSGISATLGDSSLEGRLSFTGGKDITLIGGTYTLKETILNGVTSTQGLKLSTTLSISSDELTSTNFTAVEDIFKGGNGVTQSNGYKVNGYYLVQGTSDAAHMTLTDSFKLSVDGTETAADTIGTTGGSVYYKTGAGTDYYVNTGTVAYAADTDIASDATTGVILNGGTLDMAIALNSNATKGIELGKDGTVNIATGVTLDASTVTFNNHTLTLTGAGEYKAGDLSQTTHVLFGQGEAAWTGYVHLQGAYATLPASGTLASDVKLSNSTDGLHAGLDINGGVTDATYTFAGAVSGTGNMGRSWSGGQINLAFTGDVSGWTGQFTIWNDSGDTSLSFTGTATINVGLNGGSSTESDALLSVLVENDNDVTIAGKITGKTLVTYSGEGVKTATNGNSNYSGGTAIEEGELIVTAKGALGTGAVTIDKGATLTIKTSGVGYDVDNAFTLNDGTLIFEDCSPSATASITLAGEATGTSVISGSNTGLNAKVSGKGNLTLQNESNILNINSEIDFTGNMTLEKGTINLASSGTNVHNTGEVYVTGATVSVKDGATLANTGEVVVSGTGVLKLESGAKVLSDIDLGVASFASTADSAYSNISLAAGKVSALSADGGTVTDATLTVEGELLLDSKLSLDAVTLSGAGTLDVTADAAVTMVSLTGDTTNGSAVKLASAVEVTGAVSGLTAIELTNAHALSTTNALLTVDNTFGATAFTLALHEAHLPIVDKDTTYTIVSAANSLTVTDLFLTLEEEDVPVGIANEATLSHNAMTYTLKVVDNAIVLEVVIDGKVWGITDDAMNGSALTVDTFGADTATTDAIFNHKGLDTEGKATVAVGEASAATVALNSVTIRTGDYTFAAGEGAEGATLSITGDLTVLHNEEEPADDASLTLNVATEVGGALLSTGTAVTSTQGLTAGAGTDIIALQGGGSFTATGDAHLGSVEDGTPLEATQGTLTVDSVGTVAAASGAFTGTLASATAASGAGITVTGTGSLTITELTGAGSFSAVHADVTLTGAGHSSGSFAAKSLTLDLDSFTTAGKPLLSLTDEDAGDTITLTLTGLDTIDTSTFIWNDETGLGTAITETATLADGTTYTREGTAYTLVNAAGNYTWNLEGDLAALQQAFAEQGAYAEFDTEGSLVLTIYKDDPSSWLGGDFTDSGSEDKWAGHETNNGGKVLDLSQLDSYEALDMVDIVNITKDTEFDLSQWEALDKATNPDGLLVQHLTGADDTLTLHLKGGADDLVTLSNATDAANGLGSSEFKGDLIIEGLEVAVTADKGNTLAVGSTELRGADARLSVDNDADYITGGLIGTEGTVSGKVTVNGTAGKFDTDTKTGGYGGGYDNATIYLTGNAEQALTPGTAAGLTVEGDSGTAELLLTPGSKAAIHTPGASGTLTTNAAIKAAGDPQLTLSEDSEMVGGTLAISAEGADMLTAANGGDIPAITSGYRLNLTGTTLAVTQVGDVTEATFDMTQPAEGRALLRLADQGTATDVQFAITSDFYDRYFEHARLVDGLLVADLVTDYYTRELARTDNGRAGLLMLDYAELAENPQQGDMAEVLDQLGVHYGNGNAEAADRLAAAVAGAGAVAAGSAALGDVDRQLRAIRNRMTTMGVDQYVVNEDMPYFNAWINGEGDYRDMSSDGTLAGYTLSSWGGTVGMDVDVCPEFTFGLAATAMYGDYTSDSADRAEGDLDRYYLSAFAHLTQGAWVHSFVATAGKHDLTLKRTVDYGTGSYDTEGDTSGTSFGLLYEVSRTFALNEDATTCWQPVFNAAYRHVGLDAYTETGSDAALRYGDQSLDMVTFGLGARLQAVVGENIYNRTSILELRTLAKFDAGDRANEADVAFASGGLEQKVKGAEAGAFGVEIGAGLTIPIGQESGALFLDASAELRADYVNANGMVGYRINF